jgi:DNA-binding transcriptional LysR family regulator
MRLEQLEYVTTVARCGSFRRAAELLHLSQPALSEGVRTLERELGVELLERGRSGTKISEEGRELLPLMLTVIDAADHLRQSADGGTRANRTLQLGTVTAATAPLLSPTIGEFRRAHPETAVEVVTAQQAEIHLDLREGKMDLGLINYLEGESISDEFETVELLRGQPVVCISPSSRLAELDAVRVEDLLAEPLIAMRPGYVMYRYLERLFGGRAPSFSFSADGSELGKLLVAQGLGSALLPDYSVIGDPLETSGAITQRPIAGDDTAVVLVIQRRRSGSPTRAARDLHRLFVERASAAWPNAAPASAPSG